LAFRKKGKHNLRTNDYDAKRIDKLERKQMRSRRTQIVQHHSSLHAKMSTTSWNFGT